MRKLVISLLLCLMLSAPCFSASQRTLLNAVTASGASSAYNSGDLTTKTIYIVASSVTTGATVAIQTSIDGTNWVTIGSAQNIVADGVTEFAIVGLLQKYIRANITSYTDGTYTVILFGKG